MSDKIGKGVTGPVKMQKLQAAGEGLAESQASMLGKKSGTHGTAKTPSRNAK
jgi:hypothetical protein